VELSTSYSRARPYMLRDALDTTTIDWSFNGGLFKRIRDIMYNDFAGCFVSIVQRSRNSVVDCLAVHGANELSGS
jgi:hypothetical protein